VSAHGLGHLRDPYSEAEAPSSIPPPTVELKKLGVKRWQYDLWYKITEAALAGAPDNVQLDWHPALKRPAAVRYAASSPKLLYWMARFNEGRPYQEQIRPFNFLLAGCRRCRSTQRRATPAGPPSWHHLDRAALTA
jgi:hypothetical protein